jgi:hypothetical protein
MKKLLLLSISICLLFTFLFVPVQADEKDLPQGYQYTFTVGSVDFHGVVDGVEGTGALLYPIYIDETCGRAGISVHLPCPDRLCTYIGTISVDPDEFYFTFGCSEKRKLTLHYPSQKAYIGDEEIPNPFPIKDVQGANTDAYWDGPNAIWDKDSYIPEVLTVSIAPPPPCF